MAFHKPSSLLSLFPGGIWYINTECEGAREKYKEKGKLKNKFHKLESSHEEFYGALNVLAS